MLEQSHKMARASFFLHLSLYRNIKIGSALHFWAKLKKMYNFWHLHHKAGSLHSLLTWSHSLIWKSIYSSAQYWKKTNFHICRIIVSYSQVHISCLFRLSLIHKLNIIKEKGKGTKGKERKEEKGFWLELAPTHRSNLSCFLTYLHLNFVAWVILINTS